MVTEAVGIAETQHVLLEALRSFGSGSAAMQPRIRTEAGGVKLSTLGAVIPQQGFVGAKVYTTIAGQFQFVIILFSAADGRPLASLEANAITRLRTAACSVIASRYLARPASQVLALFGTGVQGRAHAVQMAGAYKLSDILICPFDDPPDMAERIAAETGVAARFVSAKEALDHADIVVTASRATTPLFAGEMLRPGTFVAAVGSSLPHTRELTTPRSAARRASPSSGASRHCARPATWSWRSSGPAAEQGRRTRRTGHRYRSRPAQRQRGDHL
jgi:ornithine cyclodeaminase